MTIASPLGWWSSSVLFSLTIWMGSTRISLLSVDKYTYSTMLGYILPHWSFKICPPRSVPFGKAFSKSITSRVLSYYDGYLERTSWINLWINSIAKAVIKRSQSTNGGNSNIGDKSNVKSVLKIPHIHKFQSQQKAFWTIFVEKHPKIVVPVHQERACFPCSTDLFVLCLVFRIWYP